MKGPGATMRATAIVVAATSLAVALAAAALAPWLLVGKFDAAKAPAGRAGDRMAWHLVPRVAAPSASALETAVAALDRRWTVRARRTPDGARLEASGPGVRDRVAEVREAARTLGWGVASTEVLPGVGSPGSVAGAFSRPGSVAAMLVLQSLPFLVLGGWLRRRLGLRPAAGSAGLTRAGAVGAAGGVGIWGLAIAIGFLQSALGFPPEEQEALRALLTSAAGRPVGIAFVVLVAPVAEETFFRGFAYAYLARYAAETSATVVSAAVFALVHLNPTALPVYFVIGLGLAAIYRRAGNLVAPVVAHAVANALTVAVYLA